jgi:hypothetical protein
MRYTKEDEFKLELENLYKRCLQLINIRWQTVGITITLISAFWIFVLPEIFDTEQNPNVMYLLLFLACLFSIIVLFVWRFITHVLSDEEAAYWDNVFVTNKLLIETNVSKFSEKQLKDKVNKIRKKELIFHNFIRCLSDEFDNFKDKKPNLVNYFFLLSDNEKCRLLGIATEIEEKPSLEKKIYSKRFESGRWKFDWAAFSIILVLYLFGGIVFSRAYIPNSNIEILKFFWSLFPWSFYIYVGVMSIVLILYILEYLIPNFNWKNTQDRFDDIKIKIYSICPEEKLKEREQETKAKKNIYKKVGRLPPSPRHSRRNIFPRLTRP